MSRLIARFYLLLSNTLVFVAKRSTAARPVISPTKPRQESFESYCAPRREPRGAANPELLPGKPE